MWKKLFLFYEYQYSYAIYFVITAVSALQLRHLYVRVFIIVYLKKIKNDTSSMARTILAGAYALSVLFGCCEIVVFLFLRKVCS